MQASSISLNLINYMKRAKNAVFHSDDVDGALAPLGAIARGI